MDTLPRSALLRMAAHAAAAAVGAKYGFDFGVQIGGAPMGFLMGANAAVFGWLMVGAAADVVLRLKRR
ncbi:MAG: hypothetical protein JNM33_13505 [Rubrivivax sp.]|nr:hypothetical protein [Rubrivivax sp.]